MDMGAAGGGRGWDKEKEALTYIHYHMQNRQLVGSCSIAQELSLVPCDDLEGWDRVGDARLRREGIYIDISTYLCLYNYD